MEAAAKKTILRIELWHVVMLLSTAGNPRSGEVH